MAREAGSGLGGKRETGGGSAGAAGSVSGAAWPGPAAHTWRRGEPGTCRGPPQCHLNSRQQGRPASWRHRPPIHGSLNAPRWRREASRGPQRQFQTVLVVPWFTQLSAVLALLFKRQKDAPEKTLGHFSVPAQRHPLPLFYFLSFSATPHYIADKTTYSPQPMFSACSHSKSFHKSSPLSK